MYLSYRSDVRVVREGGEGDEANEGGGEGDGGGGLGGGHGRRQHGWRQHRSAAAKAPYRAARAAVARGTAAAAMET